jgi:hypothetical protein
MKQRFAFVALFVAVFCAAPVLAQCQKPCEHAKSCASKTQCKASCQSKTPCLHGHGEGDQEHAKDAKTAMCASDVTCDGDRVRFESIDLPRIAFKVGDTLACCMKSATQMAEGDSKKIKFAVAGKTYDNLGDAKVARLEALEKYYDDILTVKYAVGDECTGCPMAAKELAKTHGKPVRYRLGTFDFEKESWVVGDTTFDCAEHAAQAAKSNGQKLEYCVGEQKTTCETTGKTRLIEARITEALGVLAKAAQS